MELPFEKKLGKYFIGSVMYVVVSSPQCGENTAFFPVFPLVGSTAKAFFGYPFGTSRNKASTIFLTQPSVLGCVVIYI